MRTASIPKTCLALAFPAVLILFSAVPLRAADALGPGACDIQHGPCSVTTVSGMSIEFDIHPKPVKPLSKLLFIVSLKDKGKAITDAQVSLDLTMPGMYMGKNASVLTQAAGGRYEGNGVITRCMSGKKTWKADILVERGSARDRAGFLFEVQ